MRTSLAALLVALLVAVTGNVAQALDAEIWVSRFVGSGDWKTERYDLDGNLLNPAFPR